jgi:hypothetical protein
MARTDDVEARVTQMAQKLAEEFADLGAEMRWSVTRALIHRAVHFGTEQPGVEFCTLATYLAEMVGHAHKLAHGENPKAASHRDLVH